MSYIPTDPRAVTDSLLPANEIELFGDGDFRSEAAYQAALALQFYWQGMEKEATTLPLMLRDVAVLTECLRAWVYEIDLTRE